MMMAMIAMPVMREKANQGSGWGWDASNWRMGDINVEYHGAATAYSVPFFL